MQTRLNPYTDHAELLQPMIEFGKIVAGQGLEPSLVELVKIRASQINGCALCLDMHVRDARRHGETEARIFMLDAWHEAPHYSERERAALAWTEALTRLSETKAPDEVYEAAAAAFTSEELVKLTLMIVAINGFNRIGVGFRLPPLNRGLSELQAA